MDFLAMNLPTTSRNQHKETYTNLVSNQFNKLWTADAIDDFVLPHNVHIDNVFCSLFNLPVGYVM